MHRRNAAEKAIRTWKNHFISGLFSTDSQFPMHLWCRLLPQATLTLNMLRASRRHTQISAYTVLEGVLTSIRHPWHHKAPKSSSMRNPPSDSLGILTALKAGIWDQRGNTTDVTACSSTRQKPNESPIPSNYFPRKCPCHMQIQLMWPSKPLPKASAFSSSQTLSRSSKWAPIKSTPSKKSTPYKKNAARQSVHFHLISKGARQCYLGTISKGAKQSSHLPTTPRPLKHSRQLFSEGGYAPETSLPHSSY